MLLSDREIKKRIASGSLVIEPLEVAQIQPNGVDLRVGGAFFDLERSEEVVTDEFEIRPGASVMMTSAEKVKFPLDLAGLVTLRSSYARKGLLIPPTVVDSGYEGTLTLGIHGGSIPVRVRKGEALWYLVLVETSPVEKPYAGRYQGAKGLLRA